MRPTENLLHALNKNCGKIVTVCKKKVKLLTRQPSYNFRIKKLHLRLY